jgi:hypothetical protein
MSYSRSYDGISLEDGISQDGISLEDGISQDGLSLEDGISHDGISLGQVFRDGYSHKGIARPLRTPGTPYGISHM